MRLEPGIQNSVRSPMCVAEALIFEVSSAVSKSLHEQEAGSTLEETGLESGAVIRDPGVPHCTKHLPQEGVFLTKMCG